MKKYITSFGGITKGAETNRHFLSYGLIRNYSAEVYRLFASALPFGYEGLFYDDKWLTNLDYLQNENGQKLLAEDSYSWIMKPVTIRDALSKIDFGDYLVFADSNHIAVNPDEMMNLCIANPYKIYGKGHNANYTNGQWCNMRMMENMGCTAENYRYSHNLHVNTTGYIKTDFVVKFVDEWAKYCTDYNTMIKNDLPNYPEYCDHRHEQASFSLLIEKYHIPYYPESESYIAELMGISI